MREITSEVSENPTVHGLAGYDPGECAPVRSLITVLYWIHIDPHQLMNKWIDAAFYDCS